MYRFIHVFEGAKHLSMKQTEFVQITYNALFHISSQWGGTALHWASKAELYHNIQCTISYLLTVGWDCPPRGQ